MLGDIITHLNDTPVQSNDDYLSAMEDMEPGDTVVIKTLVGDEEKTYTVELTESQ